MNDKIELDWEYYLKTNTFLKKGELPPKPVINDNTLSQFLLLSLSDKAIAKQYKLPEIYKKTVELFKDEPAARKWLIEESTFFFNKSPIESLIAHGPSTILKMLDEKLGKNQKTN